jgi:hypothetical protein
MALIQNSFGGVDLLATVKQQDISLTALEAKLAELGLPDTVSDRLKVVEDELSALRAALAPKE